MNPCILVVDDSSLQRRAIVDLLQPYAVRCVQAADGAQGLELVRTERPDLVLLDYNMPVLDGAGFLKALRADPAIGATRVLLLTANSSPQVLATAARLGVRDFLLKPVDGPQLIGKISRQLALAIAGDLSSGTPND